MYLAAALQMTSTVDRAHNHARAARLVAAAADAGAQLIGLPEMWPFMGPEAERLAHAETLEGPSLSLCRGLAEEHGVWILAGSIPEQSPDAAKVFNTSALVSPDGTLAGVYRKVHLFDVDIPDGARYRESAGVASGSETCVAATPLGKIGLSVCYDLRFPELYRALSAKGAELVTVPSAFTLYTGKDHWEVLLRARAIEDLCYVLAPAQFGRHSEKRVTYGHAMLVHPWGTVLACAADGEGMAIGPVDLGEVQRVRRELPALAHRRL